MLQSTFQKTYEQPSFLAASSSTPPSRRERTRKCIYECNALSSCPTSILHYPYTALVRYTIRPQLELIIANRRVAAVAFLDQIPHEVCRFSLAFL